MLLPPCWYLLCFAPNRTKVVQHTLALLGTLTELQPGLSEVMLGSPGLGPALEFSLLHTPERLVRKEVSAGVLRMAISLRSASTKVSCCRRRVLFGTSGPMHLSTTINSSIGVAYQRPTADT